MLIGGFVFGMILGIMSNISKDANPAESKRAQQTALLNSFVLDQEKNPELAKLIRGFKVSSKARPSLVLSVEFCSKTMPFLVVCLAVQAHNDSVQGVIDSFKVGDQPLASPYIGTVLKFADPPSPFLLDTAAREESACCSILTLIYPATTRCPLPTNTR